ncbi:hypothetical protein Glove_208g31 [Diversispora epigaea]|uniref:Uncharacterized protein n=1 Tax=Diversispora epigaea TaxID=1348612 RepID=A0A397ITU2_9GLOM|nr:hypothetical protein Glove_208g31 [Diversispora epigaea]
MLESFLGRKKIACVTWIIDRHEESTHIMEYGWKRELKKVFVVYTLPLKVEPFFYRILKNKLEKADDLYSIDILWTFAGFKDAKVEMYFLEYRSNLNPTNSN